LFACESSREGRCSEEARTTNAPISETIRGGRAAIEPESRGGCHVFHARATFVAEMARRGNPYAKPDRFTRAAKEAGFPARSVFKLEDIDRRTRLFRKGMRVLDLGAAPGSWSLYAAQRIGRAGKLLAIDLEPLAVTLPPGAVFLQGNVFAIEDELAARFAPYDVVLSDLAPKTTGSRITDQARSFELFMRALAVAIRLGAPGGSFVGKIFMSDDLPMARAELRRHYDAERLLRPEGTRGISSEIFAVASGKRR
jgi:23S rRNA (uridine2552-2'-O)-methyltransferase